MLNDEQWELMVNAKDFSIATGWSVFPVVGKVPPQGFSWPMQSSSDEHVIEDMPWDTATGFAIDCGKSGVCVLDIDDLNVTAQLQGWTDTTRQDTNKGLHFLYKAPPYTQRNTAGKPIAGVDIRGQGGYIVAWNPGQILNSLNRLVAWPKTDVIGADNEAQVLDLKDLEQDAVDGERNHFITSEGGRIVKMLPGIDLATLNSVLQDINQTRCKPPLGRVEVMKVAGSLMRYIEPEVKTVSKEHYYKGRLKDIPPQPERRAIWGQFLGVGEIMALYGRSGIAKTVFASELVHHACMGVSFFNIPTTEPKGVLWVNGDMPLRVIPERLGYLDREGLEFMNLPSKSLLDNPEGFYKECEGFELIILDHILALLPVDDINSVKDAKVITDFLTALASRGHAVLAIGHAAKSNVNPNLFGSSALETPLQSAVGLKLSQKQPSDGRRVIETDYQKIRGAFPKTIKFTVQEKVSSLLPRLTLKEEK